MNRVKVFIAFIFLSVFAVSISAQNLYPNELKEYKLIGNKKLSSLKIGISTRAEVKNIFNSDCEYECDYDRNWVIKFKYFSQESLFPLKDWAEVNVKRNPKYIGKLFSIILMPKSVIPFTNVELPEMFEHVGGAGVTINSGTAAAAGLSSERYRDSYGLEYELQYETPLTNDGKENLKEKTIRLESIRYGASDVLARKMFISSK